MSKAIKRQISKEDEVIGSLKEQFIRQTLHGQRQIGVSPAIAVGNIALAYHRGRAAEREDIIEALKKKFPKAAKYLQV